MESFGCSCHGLVSLDDDCWMIRLPDSSQTALSAEGGDGSGAKAPTLSSHMAPSSIVRDELKSVDGDPCSVDDV